MEIVKKRWGKCDARDEENTSPWQGCRRLGDEKWTFLRNGMGERVERGVRGWRGFWGGQGLGDQAVLYAQGVYNNQLSDCIGRVVPVCEEGTVVRSALACFRPFSVVPSAPTHPSPFMYPCPLPRFGKFLFISQIHSLPTPRNLFMPSFVLAAARNEPPGLAHASIHSSLRFLPLLPSTTNLPTRSPD